MQSRGGLAGAETARIRPVRLFLSGPAGGVMGALSEGKINNFKDLITVDIGGTSCDIALISDAKPLIRQEGVIDKYLVCLLYTSPSPRDATLSRMPSSA